MIITPDIDSAMMFDITRCAGWDFSNPAPAGLRQFFPSDPQANRLGACGKVWQTVCRRVAGSPE